MEYPSSLKYTKDHEWIKMDGDIAVVGITYFAQSELGDIVYVEVETVGESLSAGDVFGTVEAVKTTSDLFMPIDGEVLEFNTELDAGEGDQPELINNSPYERGWIVKLKPSNPEQIQALLSADEYQSQIPA